MKTEELKIFIPRNQIQSKPKPKDLKLYDCKAMNSKQMKLETTAAKKWAHPAEAWEWLFPIQSLRRLLFQPAGWQTRETEA